MKITCLTDVAVAWASGIEKQINSSRYSLHYRSLDTIASYNLTIARRYDDAILLLTPCSTVTTNKHIRYVRDALDRCDVGRRVFNVPWQHMTDGNPLRFLGDANHAEIWRAYITEAKNRLAMAEKARGRKEEYITGAIRSIREANDFRQVMCVGETHELMDHRTYSSLVDELNLHAAKLRLKK